MILDFFFVLQWWFLLFLIGIITLPLTSIFFKSFLDKGYIFSKIIGTILISYISFILGVLHIAPFSTITLYCLLIVLAIGNIILMKKNAKVKYDLNFLKLVIVSEVLFLAGILFWSYIRAHQPNIYGLEKYMDYGFINSILRSDYFPPKDMWFAPLSINYYYFGHLTTAVLTKLVLLPSFITYNPMVATIFAFSFTAAFSLIFNILYHMNKSFMKGFVGGIFAGFFLTLGGNLHTIYAFFQPYKAENPQPFWELPFAFSTFPNAYWYPNATRFIYNTIHEFPMYSFVVSDLHGHVLSIPFVLLTVAFLYSFFKGSNLSFYRLPIIGFLLAVLYMTNSLDGPIYLLLATLVIVVMQLINLHTSPSLKSYLKTLVTKTFILPTITSLTIVIVSFVIFSLPFNIHFKPFVSGIGVLCAYEVLYGNNESTTTQVKTVGPFIFEQNHCLRSPWWQLVILHGFFYFFVISFIIFLIKQKLHTIKSQDIFILILIFVSTILIITPEFIYAKDIYPNHYRANTMFKLVYQAFMMLSLVAGYVLIRISTQLSSQARLLRKLFTPYSIFVVLAVPLIMLVMIYPYFSTNSYYEELKTYRGLDGIAYLKTLRPGDYEAITWINKNISGQPVILEAQGDSYTDYARISANTGLVTVLGWTVHEWLWRGSYDIPAPRIEDVRLLYESTDIKQTTALLKKYAVSYVYIGDLERQKYASLNKEKFEELGDIVYSNNTVILYKID